MNVAADRLPESIVCSAIEWQMRLRDNAGNLALRQQVQDWRRADGRHELAWQRLQQMNGLFQASQLPEAAHTIPLLQRADADLSRRRTLKLLGLGLVLGSTALVVSTAPPAWRSDIATHMGERRRVTLGHDLEVLLNTDSSLDVDGHQLLLRAGEVQVDGAHWRMRCRFAQCEGHQARVVVRERDGYSEIRVERGDVRVVAQAGHQWLRAGEGLSVSTTAMTPLGSSALDPFAWTRGLLVVHDIRLADFLAEAGRYTRGWLGCDETVANLRLSGVFHLDEPTLMLRNITHLLPVRIVERTRWWTRIVSTA